MAVKLRDQAPKHDIRTPLLREALTRAKVHHQWTDTQLSAVLDLTDDVGLAVDALAREPQYRWVLELLANA